ncbi:helicase HerA-like domain-containing protein [Agrococcus sp. Ld7]|uniref:helicase HerA-like domain-containing protein n=1 Tax=Agrococcus sp. Ld7 TaxID=649148 RepID=UPI003870D79F
MTDELARVQAEIEAARQAQREAEARLAALQDSERLAEQQASASEETTEPDEAPVEERGSGGPLDAAAVAEIRSGYAFAEAALEMGALVNGEADPETQIRIPLQMVNRHGLIAGATGTGKTKTLQVLTEQLSAAGVPVFAADIKGDLSGIATPGASSDKLLARTSGIGQAWTPRAAPVEYFALGGIGHGVPVRATVLDFGPTLLSKVLGLNDTQESSLGLIFAYADQAKLPLVDLKDLRELLLHLTGDAGKEELRQLGGISSQTAGVILRELTAFSAQGADVFFGEPQMDTREFLRVTPDGRGVVSLLEVPGVADQPALFSTFLMWLLADLFEDLPEVGDIDKPKLVFFFDEAHLLFKDASKDFLAAIVQTVRLIRSKGVGIFFVTQTPKDVPGEVLAQLGSRVQHQLRAHTPDAEKALRATVRTYPKSAYDLEQVLTGLGIGEAIVTVMNERGAPTPVAWTRLRAPEGSMDPTPETEIERTVTASALLPKYGEAVDRESAYEMLQARLQAAERAEQDAASRAAAAEEAGRLEADAKRNRSTRSSTSATGGNVITDFLGSRSGQAMIRDVVRGIFGNWRR